MTTTATAGHANRLVFSGLFLFLLGLVVGLLVQNLANPRMGLAAHLEGVMNGLFLIVLGLLWKKLLLPGGWLRTGYWLAVYGTFANFVAVVISAVSGYGKMMPLAGGREGTAWIEALISFLLISLSLAMLAVCVIALIGFYRHMKQTSGAAL